MSKLEPTLFWRIFLPNALVLVVAATVLVLSPAEVPSRPTAGHALALGIGLLVMLALNLLLIRRAVEPLEQLTAVIAEIDPLQPGQRVDVSGGAETEQLVAVFNSMLARLEAERREAGRRMLAAQESERVRLARELHDEVGQVVTGLILEIDHAARVAPAEVRGRLADAREAARGLSRELGEIVSRLRPETLDDLGLASALTVLGDEFTDQTGIPVHRKLAVLPEALTDDAELAVYRVAQESLTNIARHSGASEVSLELRPTGEMVLLRIADNGRGLDGEEGNGVRGMRERAMLVGGSLTVAPSRPRGTEVRLSVPQGSR